MEMQLTQNTDTGTATQAPQQGMLMNPFDAPIPGESLTTDPESRMPFEKPPKFTEVDPAIREIFMRITDEENLDNILDILREKTPVEDLAQVILFEGFRQGQYTPDLMLLLIEPTIYLLLSIANYAQIDVSLYPEEDFPEEENEDGGASTRDAVEKALSRMKEGGDTAAVVEQGDVISVGEQQFSRPSSVSPSLMDEIKNRMATEVE